MKETEEERWGYVTGNVGREVREGESGHNAANGRPRNDSKREEVHSVRILRVEIMLLHVHLVIENNGAVYNVDGITVLREVVEEGIPHLPLQHILIVHLHRDQQRQERQGKND